MLDFCGIHGPFRPRCPTCDRTAALRSGCDPVGPELEDLVEKTIRLLAERGLICGGLGDELEAEKLIEDI